MKGPQRVGIVRGTRFGKGGANPREGNFKNVCQKSQRGSGKEKKKVESSHPWRRGDHPHGKRKIVEKGTLQTGWKPAPTRSAGGKSCGQGTGCSIEGELTGTEKEPGKISYPL